MARLVVEPAVVMKWFVPEVFSSPAARLLDGGHELLAPDTILIETVGIVTAKIRLDEISEEEGNQILKGIQSVPIMKQPADLILEPALTTAAALDIPLRDAMNIVVAVHADCRLVTANNTLYDKIYGTAFAVHMKWIEDLR